MKKSNKETQENLPVLQVIKTASCPTLEGTSELSYCLAKDAKDYVHVRIVRNSGSGHFSKEWVTYNAVKEALPKESITSVPLRKLFKGKSLNTSGFLLAVMLAEGLITRMPGKRTRYIKCSEEPFLKQLQTLIESKIDLTDQEDSDMNPPYISYNT